MNRWSMRLDSNTTHPRCLLLLFSFTHFCCGTMASLQAPFYPQEAMAKGASATEYSLVFSIFELAMFIFAPVFGKNMSSLGVKVVFTSGIIMSGLTTILFGVLCYLPDATSFIAAGLVTRVLEGIGVAAYTTAMYSIICHWFPKEFGFVFATVQGSFGLGLVLGPFVGTILFKLGGFPAPFAVIGILVLGEAWLGWLSLSNIKETLARRADEDSKESLDAGQTCPMDDDDPRAESKAKKVKEEPLSMIRALKIATVFLALMSNFCASASIGYLMVSLEPNLQRFTIPSLLQASAFPIYGLAFAISNVFFGAIMDKWATPAQLNFCGSVAIWISILFQGPISFIPIPPTFPLVFVAVMVLGIGLGAQNVSAFKIAHSQAIKHNFPDNLKTYALISGLQNSVYALGAFTGPLVTGVSIDVLGVRGSGLFLAAMLLVFLISFISVYGTDFIRAKLPHRSSNGECESLLEAGPRR